MKLYAVLALAILTIALPGAERLDPRVLTAVKEGTAYIKTNTGTGSGFVVRTNGKVAWLATNAHVVADARLPGSVINAVFASGTTKERSLVAEIAALDDQRDIAILRLEGEDLPKPLPLQPEANLQETMAVWVIGFPFGDNLAVGNANPAPTITPTQISSLRADAYGNIEAIQTSGGINPGNSGGPIVNTRGGVVGISVAKIRGAEIGFGIPCSTLQDSLAGRMIGAVATVNKLGEDSLSVEVTASCFDPFGNISRITALVAPASKVTSALKSNEKGKIVGPITSGMTELALDYKNQAASGTTKLRLPKDGAMDVVVQFRYQRKDGGALFTNEIRNSHGGTSPGRMAGAGGTTPPSSGAIISFTYTPPVVKPVDPAPGATLGGTIERDSSGRSYSAAVSPEIAVDVGANIINVAVHPSGKEIYAIYKDEPAIMVIDPLTWKTVAEIPTPENPTSIWADSTVIGVACGKSRVVSLVDVAKRSLIASGSSAELAGFTPDTMIGRAPDGTVMSVWQLDGGAWWDRALVHTALDGKTRIMIKGEPLAWATWLPNGTGVIGQGPFDFSPSGTFDLAYPQGPKNVAELHNSQLLGGGAPFHCDSGRAFLTADRKAVVWRRQRVKQDDGNYGPWTYLLSPGLDSIIRDFPGSAVAELPEQRMFITVGNEKTVEGVERVMCYYISSADGRVLRRVALETKERQPFGRPNLIQPSFAPLYIPGHELLLMPKRNMNARGTTELTYSVYRCGPMANAVQAPASAPAGNDPPPVATPGTELTYAPSLPAGSKATNFRLKRALPGMTIDATTGSWNWRPGKEHIGRWTVTILATVDGEESTVITWTLTVK